MIGINALSTFKNVFISVYLATKYNKMPIKHPIKQASHKNNWQIKKTTIIINRSYFIKFFINRVIILCNFHTPMWFMPLK